jgi:DNA-binding CsgD family transcriptional regulator
MEFTGTTATNSDANEFCIGRTVGKIRPRKVGATPAQAQGLATKKGVSASKSATGFLLLDSSLSIVSFNREAVQILSYPDNVKNLTSSELLLTETIRSRLITQPSPGESVFVKEFKSGRRHYFCRAFLIDSHTKEPGQPTTAVLLERGPSGLVPLSQVCQQFNLTQREQEVLVHLLQGIRNKEIANRMNISPNTVRAFLRLIMIKTGVSSRSAIVGKIMMTRRNVGA